MAANAVPPKAAMTTAKRRTVRLTAAMVLKSARPGLYASLA
jgi:hypothetical protein